MRVVGHPELRKCNYGRWIYVPPENDTDQKREARATIGPYMEHPVPPLGVRGPEVGAARGRSERALHTAGGRAFSVAREVKEMKAKTPKNE